MKSKRGQFFVLPDNGLMTLVEDRDGIEGVREITNLDWKPEDVNPAEFVAKYGQPKDVKEDWKKRTHLTQQEIGQTLKERWNIQTSENCQVCHR